MFTPWLLENITSIMRIMTTINSPKNQTHGGSCCKTNHDEVARVAFCLYEKQGSQNGQDVRNWLDAEAHVKAMHASTVHGRQTVTKTANSTAR